MDLNGFPKGILKGVRPKKWSGLLAKTEVDCILVALQESFKVLLCLNVMRSRLMGVVMCSNGDMCVNMS